MELLLRVETRVGPARSADLRVTVQPDHTVSAVASEVAAYLGAASSSALSLVRAETGERLDGAVTVEACGLLSGEHLVLAQDGSAAGVQVPVQRGVCLHVTGGPSAGLSRVLGPGTHRFGRNDDAHVTVEDRSVGSDHLTLRVLPDLTVVAREKDGPVNKATLNGEASPQEFPLSPRDVVKIGATSLKVSPFSPPAAVATDALGQLPFHRTPRRPEQPKARTFGALGDIPARPDPPVLSTAAMLVPLVGGVAMAAIFGPRFLLFVLLAPVTALASWFEGKRERRKRYERAVVRFTERLGRRQQELDEALQGERARRESGAPDTADLLIRAQTRSKELWHRGRDHEDFLGLRVGVGDVPPLVTVEQERGGEDELRDAVLRANEVVASLPEVPITVPVRELGVVGIHGQPAAATGLAHSLLVQAVCLHSPEDLVVAAAAGPDCRLVEWLKWVPHTRSTGSPLAGPHLAQDTTSADALLTALLEVAEFRAQSTGHGVDRRWPWILVALDRRLEPDPAVVSQLLDLCPDVGISVIWISDRADRLPPQTRVIAECQPADSGRLSRVWFTDPDLEPHAVDLEGVDPAVPDRAGRALAPLRDASSSSKTAAIPRVAPLLTALGVEAVSKAWVKQQWAKDRGYAVTTTIGISADGPLQLDLVEHGPHALIGGTSGAGKSELLQSLVAGLVANHSPSDVNLLFIDFKGGSASEVFKALPHVVGRVTDLDESLALRAQASVRAELRRRVGDFAKLGMKDLREMRDKHPDAAPPSLVIVIDEFATLVKELPDFVAGLVDIAQRGRSYGIHLILATQRPSAAVDDNILANTNLRISLRMLDSAESSSVIGSPEAAEIPVPLKGRALARLGPGQLVEFQSAFSGAPVRMGRGPEPVRISAFGASDATRPAPAVESKDAPTQLEALIGVIAELEEPQARQIWNPVLTPTLELGAVRKELAEARAAVAARQQEDTEEAEDVEELDPLIVGRHITVGKLDDPDAQKQYPAVIDLESGGGLLVFASGRSGKSSALRTLAVSAALDDSLATKDGLALFVLDFSSGALADLAALPQCAAVGTAADLEATTRILAVLDREIAWRRTSAGQCEAPGDRPRVIVLVDGYPALAEALLGSSGSQEQSTDEWLNTFLRIATDGRQVGVHVVIAADRASTLRSSLLASITTRVVLRQADDAEARELGAPSTRTMPPGGGYLMGLRLQLAQVPEATPELAAKVHGQVPKRLRAPALLRDVAVRADSPTALQGIVGISDLTAEPVRFDLTYGNMFVSGPPQSGRSCALLTVAQELQAAGQVVYAVGPEDSGLQDVDAAETGWGREEAAAVLGVLKGHLGHGRSAKKHVLVFDDLDLMDYPELYPHFEALLADKNLRIVGSAGSVSGFYSNRLIQELPKKARQILYLQPGSSREVADFLGLTRLPLLRMGLDMPAGRGLFVANRRSTVVQVSNALADGSVPEQRVA